MWRAIEPPIETEIFIADCLTQSGYDDVCKGKRAALRGELGGDARQRVLLIGESELNIELDEARIDAISGQEVEVAGRFGRGGMSSREEVRPAKIVQVLTSQADAGQRIAAREARSERETIRERCVGRTPGDLASTLCELEMGSSNSMLAYTSCMEDAGQLERRCRAAGF